MSLVHADALPDDPVFVHSYGYNALGNQWHGLYGTVATTGNIGGDTVRQNPFFLNKPYRIARWFWLHGATVGTNYFRAAIWDNDWRLVAQSRRTLSAGTVNQVQYSTPGPAVAHVNEFQNSTDANNYTTGSIFMRAGFLYLFAIENSHGTSASAVSAITGGGTWTSRATTLFNTNLNRVSLWSCVPTTDYLGTMNIAFGGVTQTGWVGSMGAVTNADTATTDGIVQQATGTGTGTTALATLAAFGSADNIAVGVVGTNVGAGTTTPVTTATSEVADLYTATPPQGHALGFAQPNDPTYDYTVPSSNWGCVAVEVKADTNPFWIPAGRYYMGLQHNGTTTTVFRKISWTEVSGTYDRTTGGLVYAQETPGSPGGQNAIPVFGFTRRASP